MSEVLSVLGVAGLFLLRVGIPVLILVTLGILVDRWQSGREAEIMRQAKPKPEITPLHVEDEDEEEQDKEKRKAA